MKSAKMATQANAVRMTSANPIRPGEQGARDQHERADCEDKIDILTFGQRSDFFH